MVRDVETMLFGWLHEAYPNAVSLRGLVSTTHWHDKEGTIEFSEWVEKFEEEAACHIKCGRIRKDEYGNYGLTCEGHAFAEGLFQDACCWL